MSRAAGRPLVAALLLAAPLGADEPPLLERRPPPTVIVDEGVRDALAEGVTLFQRARADALLRSDPFERFGVLAQPDQLALFEAERRYDDVFLDGDDAFAFEWDSSFGAGRGPAAGAGLPRPPQPVHDDVGGLDGASCRACHFVGGPDGAGTSTQRAYLRGDGRRASSASVRDAPHLMGLGAVDRLARELSEELGVARAGAESLAATTTADVAVPLVAKGLSFGRLIARPGGVVDTREVRGVSADLVVRPFGHKGRHADLVALVDEALEQHHGIQTASLLTRRGEVALDQDGDGVEAPALWRDGVAGAEASSAQSLLMAGYLALIGVPEVHPPQAPDLLARWAFGRALLDDAGCTLCHVEQLPLHDDVVRLSTPLGGALTLPLGEAGQEPRAVRTDFLPGAPFSTSIFLYSDLRRHDLGDALADAADEPLPGGGSVARAEWLTRSLWGVADTGPYLHDGRAPTLHEAIVAHGGEAAGSRDAYLLLSEADQASLRLFLMSLTRHAPVIVE